LVILKSVKINLIMTTIKDVATEAGVSVATVSRVINNEKYVSEDMREHVLKVISEMNYQPDAVARGLRTKSTHIISLVIPDICNPYFPEVSRGVQSVADLHKYIVVLCNTDRSLKRELEFYEKLSMQKVEGIIINPSSSKKEEIDLLHDLEIPVVLISSQRALEDFDIVMVDNKQGAALAVNHLIELGHRRIGLVGGVREVSSARQRREGFIKALKKAGLTVYQELLTEGTFDHEGGYQCMKSILSLKERPSAVFAANDIMAIGGISAIYESGLRIPEDISLIGFDDISFAKMTYPKLTTISQPMYETGKVATELLFQRIDNLSESLPPQKVVLSHNLVIRETTQAV